MSSYRGEQIALTFAGLEKLEEGQRGIEGFFSADSVSRSKPASPMPEDMEEIILIPAPEVPAKRPIPSPMNAVSEASGSSPKKPRLPTLHTSKRKTALESFLAKKAASNDDSVAPLANGHGLAEASSSRVVVSDVDETVSVLDDEGAWTCPKCQAVLTVSDETDVEDRSRRLEEQRREHADYHFALDLQQGTTPPKRTEPKPRKKKKGEGGIKAFFAPKSRS